MSAAPVPPFPGPGSQPAEEDDAQFDFMEMPKGMHTYSMPQVPEPEDASNVGPALEVLKRVQAAVAKQSPTQPCRVFDLTGLDDENRKFIDQVLGEGEVSIVAGSGIQAQESVLAGIWRVHYVDETGALLRDTIEAGAFPGAVLEIAQLGAQEAMQPLQDPLPAGVLNAPALITELDDKISHCRPGAEAHVINLTLLPLSEEDLAFLDRRLGKGDVTILSRGYGNCRITSTRVRNVWWVQYFNSRDALILNTIEVVDVPEVACAAAEDLEDSAQRLMEILGVYR